MSQQGLSIQSIQQLLSIQFSPQSFRRWKCLFEETRCVIKDPIDYERRGRPARLTRDECAFMIKLVRSEPGLFLDKIREKLYENSGVLLSTSGVHRALVKKLSITLKKPDTKNIRKSLVSKYAYVERMEFFPADFLVFTDECSFADKDLLQTYARLEKGTPSAKYLVNQNPDRLSLLPAISIDGLLALTTTFDTFTGQKFKHFLEFNLLPQMNRYPNVNSVLVCDHAAIHRGKHVRELCNAAGIQVLFLPPYCPELNPIKLCFASIKQDLRASQILNRKNDPEWEIQQAAAKIMTEELCLKVYHHCGYFVPNQ